MYTVQRMDVEKKQKEFTAIYFNIRKTGFLLHYARRFFFCQEQ